MEIGQIIKYVILGLDLSVIALLLINFLIGLIRGFGKSLNRLIVVSICALGFLLLINPITKKVAKTEIPVSLVENVSTKINLVLPEEILIKDKVSFEDAVSTTILVKIYGNNLPETHEMENFIKEYSFIAVKVVVYIAGLILLLLAHVIVDIISLIIRKILKIKLKRKKRLLGGLVYIVRYAVFFVVVMLPLFGIISLSQNFCVQALQYKDEISINKDTVNVMEDYVDAIDKSITKKIVLKPLTVVFANKLSDDMTLDAKYVGKGLSTETLDGEKINFYDEYQDTKKIIPTVMKVMGMTNDDNSEKVIILETFTNEDIDSVVNFLKNSKLIPSAIPPVIEYAVANCLKTEGKDEETIKNDAKTAQILKKLQNVNWKKELANFSEVLNVFKEYNNVVINLSDSQSLLKNKGVINLAKGILEKILSLSTVKDVAIPLFVDVLVESLSGEKDLGINVYLLKEINWENEVNPIFNALEKIADAYVELNVTTFDKTTISTIINKENISKTIQEIMEEVMKSDIVQEILLPVVCGSISDLVPSKEDVGVDLSFVTAIFTKENIVELFTKDENIQITINVLKTIDQLGLFDNDATLDLTNNDNIVTLADTAKNIFNYTVLSDNNTKGNIFKALIDLAGVNKACESFGIELAYNKVTNWNNEIDNVFEIVKKVLTLTTSLDSFDFAKLFEVDKDQPLENQQACKETICDIIERLAKSEIFGDSILSLINGFVSSISPDYEITITETDKQLIEKAGGTGWHVEVMTIFNVIENALDILEISDYNLLPAEKIRDIMNEASNGVIATKIFGTVLNKLLNGKVSTDFTNRDNMRNCSNLVYNLLSIATASTIDLSNPENTKALVENIVNLAKDEEVLDTLTEIASEVLGEELPVELDKETIQEAASIISSVMDEYQNLSSEQQEDFSIDDLPSDLKEKIEESSEEGNEFANLIFNYLFG